NDEEALLVRGGFNHVLKGAIIGRSTAGFFYVAPDILMKSRDQIRAIVQEKEARFYEYAKTFSQLLKEMLPFIGFIDKEFNRFDHYQARVMFARAKNYQMLQAQKDDAIILDGFEHPALQKAKPISVDFSTNVLMITGVNAGGKTMLLKSILSAAFMAKYIIPMKINVSRSHIGNFKRFEAVIDDPQNVKNDISTFAGRMVQFSKLFAHRSALVGVDEIELGTDSDEAAALFKGILDELITKGQKIVVTTHHKRLAALMADRDDVELMAAVYDEDARLPTYEFLQGIIGKSYAFETALRYGISNKIVSEAKVIYGENHEKLNQLIERGSQLERDLKRKNSLLDEKLEKVKQREEELKAAKAALEVTLENEKKTLKSSYQEAINLAKKAAKGEDTATIHRQMNAAKKELPVEIKKPDAPVVPELQVGDKVKYRQGRGHILSIKGNQATIEVEGMRMRVKKRDLKFSGNEKVAVPKTQVKVQKEKRSGLKLDLHGLRAEEAIEKMDVFLSDALIAGWDEVIIYHGIGTGKLAYAVKNFLKSHPSVQGFEDAPPHFGGFGAKVVKL
ncbi:MAG TPA: endonuclease MutS2, partial [Helicobacteraceae bacterium]|nr:endonuclease MutS2 [Helicobacteraceae bacterium]